MSYFLPVDRDITSIRQSLRFFPGETIGVSRCLSVTILDDNAVEADETCYLTISSTGAVQAIVNTTANITIYPDSDCKFLFVVVVVVDDDAVAVDESTIYGLYIPLGIV